MSFSALILQVLLIPLVFWLLSGFRVVGGKTAAIVEIFGKPMTAAKMPGLYWIWPYPIASVVGRLDLRQQQIQKEIEVKTRDDAFVHLPISIQMHVSEHPVAAVKAYYKFANAEAQILSYVLNVVRQAASGMSLAELYTDRDRITSEVTSSLSQRLNAAGYQLDAVLVDQPTPSKELQAAFNRVLAADRLRQAAEKEAEAERIRRVGIARAEMESKELQGQGLAKQRAAISQGLKESMQTFKEAMPGADENLIVAMMLATNQMDMLTTVSGNKAATIVVPYGSAGSLGDLGGLLASLKSFQAGVPSAAPASVPSTEDRKDGPGNQG